MDMGTDNEAGQRLFRKALEPENAIKHAVNGLLSTCFQFWPDVVLLVSGFLIPTELIDLIRSRRMKVVILHTELPYEFDRELNLAEHADLSLVNDPIYLDKFREVTKAEYMPHAYRPRLHRPGIPHPELVSDFAFVGTAFESRIKFFEAMDFEGIDFLLAGNWMRLEEDSSLRKYLAHDREECLPNSQAVNIYRGAKVGFNLYRRESERPEYEQGWACSPREIEMAACQLFYLRDSRPEGDELFPMLPTFGSPEEASELLRWWLSHEVERQEAAVAARIAVASRTFKSNAENLLRLLSK